MKKRIIWSIISVLSLSLALYVVRYPLFHMTRMGQWPFTLHRFGLFVILIAWIPFARFTMIGTVVGYVVGFIAGYLFQSSTWDDMRRGYTNNQWSIWMFTYLATILLGILIDIFIMIIKDKNESSSAEFKEKEKLVRTKAARITLFIIGVTVAYIYIFLVWLNWHHFALIWHLLMYGVFLMFGWIVVIVGTRLSAKKE